MANIQHGTLAPGVVTTITLNGAYGRVEVLNRNGLGEIFFRCDGEAPTVDGTDCLICVAAISSTQTDEQVTTFVNHKTVVELISNSACTFSVIGS